MKITNEIKERWKAEVNEFWTKVLQVSVVLGTSAVGIISADAL